MVGSNVSARRQVLVQKAIGGNISEGFIRDFWDKVKSQSAFPDRNSSPVLYPLSYGSLTRKQSTFRQNMA